jgi:hypothetical protein
MGFDSMGVYLFVLTSDFNIKKQRAPPPPPQPLPPILAGTMTGSFQTGQGKKPPPRWTAEKYSQTIPSYCTEYTLKNVFRYSRPQPGCHLAGIIYI